MNNEKLDVRDGIILIDKPAGVTSFAVVRELRKRLNIKKIGHAGTLDPMATGLLIVGLGKGTKQLAGFLKQDKTYEATIILGLSTETGDIDGRIVREVSATDIEEKQVQKAIQTMVGALDLPVPLFSAIKKNGKALYKHAYRGNPENIVPPMRTMRVYDVEYFGMTKKGNTVEIHARFDVGSGVYVRSLAEELGRRLAVPATLGALRRTKVGMYKIKDAVLPGDVY